MDIKELRKKFDSAQTEKYKFKTLYEDVYKYGMPDRYSNIQYNKEGYVGQKNMDEVYSSAMQESCEGFVQRVQSLLFPVNMDWIDLEAGFLFDTKQNESKKDAVNKELSKMAQLLNTYKNISNFDMEATKFSYELIAGTAVLLVKEGTFDNPLSFTSIPFSDITIVDGVDGKADTFFRTLKVKNKLIEHTWKGAKWSYEENEADKLVDLIEATYYDYDKKVWNYVVFDSNAEKIAYENKTKTSPFVDLRWGKLSNETYGRGQGLKVIADFKMLNKIKKYSIECLAFTIPAFTATEDCDFANLEVNGGAVNPVRANENSNPPIKKIDVGDMKTDLQQYNMVQLEMNVRRGLLATSIPNDPNRKMTATEVAERIQELDNTLANTFGAFVDFQYRLIQRIVEVLQTFGYIDPQNFDVKSFNGFNYRIKVNTQLANQQANEEVQKTLQAIGLLAQLDPTMQFTTKVIDMNKMVPYLLEKMGVRKDFIRGEDEIIALQQQEAEAMAQQQQQAMVDDVAVANAKEMGKANAGENI